MGFYRARAPAKVNLSLHVRERRPDGFHQIESLMVPLSLADELTVEVGAPSDEIRVPGKPELEGSENLCLRAVEAFRRRIGPAPGVRIHLHKSIPAAAGLGGGSSDAAAVLRCLAREFALSLDDPRLVQAALEVGSDVPFFLRSEPAIVRGRGEFVEAAPPLPDPLHLVLLHPSFAVSAAEAYGALAELRGGSIPPAPPPPLPLPDLKSLVSILKNDLQTAVSLRYPIQPLIDELLRAGALGALMSGSGPTVFGLFSAGQAAERGASTLRGHPDWRVWVVTAGRSHATLVRP